MKNTWKTIEAKAYESMKERKALRSSRLTLIHSHKRRRSTDLTASNQRTVVQSTHVFEFLSSEHTELKWLLFLFQDIKEIKKGWTHVALFQAEEG